MVSVRFPFLLSIMISSTAVQLQSHPKFFAIDDSILRQYTDYFLPSKTGEWRSLWLETHRPPVSKWLLPLSKAGGFNSKPLMAMGRLGINVFVFW